MSNQPLGIADLYGGYFPFTDGEFWFWCRRHEQVHKVGEKCVSTQLMESAGLSVADCKDVGPFMSYGEANRLQGIPNPVSHAPMTWWNALGMEVER